MLNANLEPLPYLDLTPIFPLKQLTIFSDMTRPRPIPQVFIPCVEDAQPKSLNKFFKSSYFIPIPVSMTVIAILSWLSSGSYIPFRLCFLIFGSLRLSSESWVLLSEELDEKSNSFLKTFLFLSLLPNFYFFIYSQIILTNPPSLVNLIAFDYRFMSICLILFSSEQIMVF